MAYFICEKQGRCCPHEFYDSIEQAITDSEDGVPCDHLIEVAPVRHGRWLPQVVLGQKAWDCSECKTLGSPHWKWCPVCGCKMDLEGENQA